MLIAVTGASGFIGSALTESLKDKGHDVLSVGRSSGDIIWNPTIGEIEAEKLGLSIISIVHSHPDHPDRPSEFDLNHAWPGFSYIIISVYMLQIIYYI